MTQQTQTKQLPKGWKQNNFAKCFNNISPTNKIPKSNYLEKGKLPVVDQGEELIAGYIREENKKQLVTLPVIIFGDHTRRFKFVNFNFVAGADGIKIFQINEDLNPKFAYYQCLTLDFPNKGYSRHFQYLKKTNLVYPESLAEQSLIVSAIETQFTRLDEAVKNLKAVKDKLELYRKAVLKKAFEKKKGWEEKKLKQIVEGIYSGFACGEHAKSGKKLIHFRPYNINSNGQISLKEIKFVDPEFSNKRLEYGDVVFNNTNSSIWVGKTCAYDKEEKIGYSNHMTRIRANQELIDFKFLAKYLHYLFLKGFYYKIMKNHVNQASVNINRLQDIIIPFPSLQEQSQIVSAIESKFSVIDKVEEIVNQALLKAEMLRKSILKSAFEGKLVKARGPNQKL